MDTGKRHLASLDSLRGIGVVLIFANHFGYIRFGWIGLWIFFALSGYLITESLLKLRALPIGQYFSRFYVKRAFRNGLVRSPLVTVTGRAVLRGMAVAGFLFADELAQEGRAVLDSRGPSFAPDFPLVLCWRNG